MITQKEAEPWIRFAFEWADGETDNLDYRKERERIISQMLRAGLVSQSKSARQELVDWFLNAIAKETAGGEGKLIVGLKLAEAIEEKPPTQPGALKELIDFLKNYDISPYWTQNGRAFKRAIELAELIEEESLTQSDEIPKDEPFLPDKHLPELGWGRGERETGDPIKIDK